MNPATQTTFAERAGRTLGRMWRGFMRLDRKASCWLVAQGWAPGVARATSLAIKLMALGFLSYAAFWLALVLALLIFAAWSLCDSAAQEAEEENKPEWREGHGGFGLYDKTEWRHDMGDPDKP